MKTVLITGGAGFLGLNIALEFLNRGDRVVIVDDLKNSYVAHINNLIENFGDLVTFYEGDVCDKSFLESIFVKHTFDTVLHLAAHKNVGESKMKPSMYYLNNILTLKNVLDCIDRFGTKMFAFPSTAVVYGNTDVVPTPEDTEASPLSPYAETKVQGEKIITEWQEKSKVPTIIFRFANPVGANTEYMFGDHSKRGYGNLIPYIIGNTLSHKHMTFRGDDHPTPDGTPIRDYLHVSDLAYAVYKILNEKYDNTLDTVNVGSGKGYSVLEIVHMVEDLLGSKLDYSFSPRNDFESSMSVLDTTKLRTDYGVSFSTNLEDIIKSEIKFYQFLHKENDYENISR